MWYYIIYAIHEGKYFQAYYICEDEEEAKKIAEDLNCHYTEVDFTTLKDYNTKK